MSAGSRQASGSHDKPVASEPKPVYYHDCPALGPDTKLPRALKADTEAEYVLGYLHKCPFCGRMAGEYELAPGVTRLPDGSFQVDTTKAERLTSEPQTEAQASTGQEVERETHDLIKQGVVAMTTPRRSRCFPFHDYGKWQDIVMTVRPALNNGPLQGTITVYGDPTPKDYQKKICARCGKKKVRPV